MARRYFHAHETARADELEGMPLASFWRRWLGYAIDLFLVALLWAPFEYFWLRYVSHEWDGKSNITVRFDFHEWRNIVVALVYFVLVNYFSNGRSVGKWIARTRVVSLTHQRLGLWQCAERVLGYAASTAEGGIGFVQYFFSPNRMCAHDRLAETIVVDVRKKARRLEPAKELEEEPAIVPADLPGAPDPAEAE
jgi:uncharacterized RDD family membrane protein YckC